MKVALVSEWLDAWRGGAETSTLQFLHQLMERDISVHVFTRSRPSPTPGMAVHCVSGASMSRTRRSITFSHRVDRMIRDGNFDVVHAISPCRTADIYQPRGGTIRESIQRNLALIRSAPARRLKRCGNAFNFKQRYQLSLERKLLGQPTGPHVVAISDYVARQLKHHYAMPEDRVTKIYNAVKAPTSSDEERSRQRIAIRAEFAIPDDHLLVILIAHNFRLKGVHRWMEALALLGRRGVSHLRSLVIGKGDSPRWHQLSARLGIADRLTFTGPSDRTEAFRSAADVFVHPTYYDPCSRVVLEGMVSGLPCVTTRWDGASEMIDEGRNGFVLDNPDDVSALADRIEALSSLDLRSRIGKAARGVKEQVSMTRHCNSMMKLYEKIATGRVT